MAFRSFMQKLNQYDTNPKDKILSFEEFIAGMEAEIDGLVYDDLDDKYKQALANAYAVLSTGITPKGKDMTDDNNSCAVRFWLVSTYSSKFLH